MHNLDHFLRLLNRYPSPHNGQPIRLKQTNSDSFEIYFDRERGLQSSDISYIFSFVSMGVFIRYMESVAHSLGHDVTYTLSLPKVTEIKGEGIILFARVEVKWDSVDQDLTLKKALEFRQTSRRKYTTAPSESLIKSLAGLSDSTQPLVGLDKKQSEQAIWLNQRAVFDDMLDEPVRKELDHWLRYSKQEKETKKDGLSYDCMEISGAAMKFAVDHPRILKAPGISWVLQQYYLRTMRDKSRVFYMLSPFSNEKQAFGVGLKIMDVWNEVSLAGHYLHPFGTIMSNHAAHQDFLKVAGVKDESREQKYLVFIFRVGISEPPAKSERLPYNKHLIIE